jgi:ABC-type uncharacterized transport system substrate-binding protein
LIARGCPGDVVIGVVANDGKVPTSINEIVPPMLRHWFALVAIAALMALAPKPSQAHPHVWIDSIVTFVFENGRVVAIEHEWKLDEFFSNFLVESFDRDKNRRFDSAELAELRKGAFDTLKEFGYFTYLQVNGKAVKLGEVETFAAELFADDTVTYRFRQKLAGALDPRAAKIAVSVHDETYFVETRVDPKDPVRFKGIADGACSYQVRDDPTKKIYMGMVPTTLIFLACTK